MKLVFTLLSTVLMILLLQGNIKAQVTSSGMDGKVTDPSGAELPGVSVVTIHLPTGTRYGVTTSADGSFHLANLKPGGPYKITISLMGYKEYTRDNIYLELGNALTLKVPLVEDSKELQEIVVEGNRDGTKTGASTNIDKETIMTLPTLDRSLQDVTKLTPQSSNNSFGGSNFRYNNITLDGAINNDAIGFSPSLGGVSGTSGMPGSSTRTNAFSLDAIGEVQTAIAPFDVKYGNFTGGNVNAVTRSGTNELSGSVYAFGRNGSLTGKSEEGSKIPSSYHDYQTGFRVGGPILKDKLFYFTNMEITRRNEPVFYEAGQGTVLDVATAQRIKDSLSSHTFMKNGTYDPGTYGAYNIYANSNKIFGRIDWNINDKHQVVIRNNFVSSDATNLERSATVFKFGSQDFVQHNRLNSLVGELKSRLSNSVSNSLVLGYSTIHDYRTPVGGNPIFPQVQINGVNGGSVFLGMDREAAIFNMRQNTFEITNNVNWFLKNHNFTLGTHNELYQIDYGFINSWNGRIDYNNLNDFFNNSPARIRATYNNSDNSYDHNFNNPSAKFNINLLSAYVQDDWKITNRFKVTPGVRLDYTLVPHGPEISSTLHNTPDYVSPNPTYTHTSFSEFNNKLFSQPRISPRLGFNWELMDDKKIVVRGGTGVFTGRIPFAWLGYAYYNNGINFGSFDFKNTSAKQVSLPTDPSQLPALGASLGQKSKTEVDLIDNKFKMPQVWRTNLAFDFKLPSGYKLTLEGIYSQVINDVKFELISLKDSTLYYPSGPTQTPIYLKGGATGAGVNNAFSNVYLLTNTHQGYRYSLTAQIHKKYNFGVDFMAAYTYGTAKDISNGIRNSMESNWQLNQAINPNNPGLAYSNFDIRHRIITSATYTHHWNKTQESFVSLVFTGQSGNPFTYVYLKDISNAGQQVSLAYIPKDEADAHLVANGSVSAHDQWVAMDEYLKNNKYLNSRRGKYTERNGARTPWNNRLDIRLAHNINFFTGGKTVAPGIPVTKVKKHTMQITFDIINFTHLLNPNWGNVYFVPNTLNSSVSAGLTPTGKTDSNGNPTFNFSTPTTSPWSKDQLNSRWQGQLGVRYLF